MPDGIISRRTVRFPGDPPVILVEMTRAKFLELFPREPIRIQDPRTGAVVAQHEMEPDDIACDSCNDDPGAVVVVVGEMGELGAYCLKCAKESWFPHCA
jgi:hypothetical protein